MNYKILMDGAIPGHNAGDIIDLSDSDGNSLAQWGIVEISKDVAPTTTVPDVAPVPAPTAPPTPEPTKAVEVPVPDKVEATTATAATDSGSPDPKARATK